MRVRAGRQMRGFFTLIGYLKSTRDAFLEDISDVVILICQQALLRGNSLSKTQHATHPSYAARMLDNGIP